MSDESIQNGAFIVEAQDVRRAFRIDSTTIQVLRGVSLQVRAGEALAIMGASGAGKSTLLHILGGLDQPTGGRVLFRGQSLYDLPARGRTEIRATRIGFVFQAYHLLPEMDLLENVMLPAMSRFGAAHRAPENRRRALALLERVGLGRRALHRPMELSGGEQQRAALARALMNEPEIVFADEPTGNLDSHTGEVVLNHLFELTREKGRTLVLVTHNDEVSSRCDRRLVLRDGALA